MELDVESVAGGGAGVGRVGGRVWFVRGALPGERIEAAAVRERAGIVEAETTRVVRPSPFREPDPCPVADRCGGCSLAHLRRDAAAGILREIAAGGLRHAPRVLAEAVADAPVEVSPWRSRLRARLHWDPDAALLGFHALRSHAVIGLETCQITSGRLHATLPALRQALLRHGAGAGEVEWLEDLEGRRAVAGWLGEGAPPAASVAGLDGWWSLDGSGRGWGEEEVTMALPVPLAVPIGAFFQANRFLVPSLFQRVADLVAANQWNHLVDLYGGVGFLAAAGWHGGAERLVVVESQRQAAEAARRNLPGAEVRACRAEQYLEAERGSEIDVVVVDAPRAGMTADARRGLVALAPPSVLVLACDVARFGRDGAALLDAGYSLTHLELWDLFAGSHHVEILALFRR